MEKTSCKWLWASILTNGAEGQDFLCPPLSSDVESGDRTSALILLQGGRQRSVAGWSQSHEELEFSLWGWCCCSERILLCHSTGDKHRGSHVVKEAACFSFFTTPHSSEVEAVPFLSSQPSLENKAFRWSLSLLEKRWSFAIVLPWKFDGAYKCLIILGNAWSTRFVFDENPAVPATFLWAEFIYLYTEPCVCKTMLLVGPTYDVHGRQSPVLLSCSVQW